MNNKFSLTRFFHAQNKTFPCWVAGRVHLENHKDIFFLKSQGLHLKCKSQKEISFQNNDLIIVEVVEFVNDLALIKDYKILFSSTDTTTKTPDQYHKMQEWFYFLKAIETYFIQQGLSAVHTPSLVECPGTEPHLEPFETNFHHNGSSQKLFLMTSPEMHLKKLLCQDWTDFFEIKKCFRNGELSSTHEPEFYMLEWYRAFFNLEDLIEDGLNFLKHLTELKISQHQEPSVKIYTVQDLFKKFLNFSFTPETTSKDLFALIEKNNLTCSGGASYEDLFFTLFLNKIENQFSKDEITIVKNYPSSLRGFAKINEEGWASRFEIYWQGLELANAFYEITDPKEQAQVFEEHLKLRSDSVPKDQDLLQSMKNGMPECSGVAFGLERLFLALTNKTSIAETKLFPFYKN